MVRLLPLTAALAAAGIALPAAPSATVGSAQTSQPQRLFRAKLLDDPRTARSVRALLHCDKGTGFVDRAIVFRDLTGDRKADAVVRVKIPGPPPPTP